MEFGSVGPYIELRDAIDWSALVLALGPAGRSGGLLLRTPSEIAFTPRRRRWYRQVRGWVTSRSDVVEIRRLGRFERPWGGLFRGDRISITSRGLRRVFAAADPDALVAALSARPGLA